MVRWGAERRRIKPQRGLDRETTTPDLPHGSITRLPSFGIDVLPFEDPDGVQLELTAPTA